MSLSCDTDSSRPAASRRLSALALLLLLPALLAAQAPAPSPTPTQATTVPLILPAGLAYNSQGDLFFAETGRHVIRKVSPTGALTTVAGTGTQGFAGDGGPALAALLDSPTAVLVDSTGNLLFSDTHNHRIRKIDLQSGIISTLAGTGVAGASPDGTSARSSRLDSPSALALDSAQNLFFADARTHLVRRIDHLSGLVTTVAGNRIQGFSGDGLAATSAALDRPSGLAIDPSGNLFLADTNNHRIRRVDHLSGIITTVAGSGLPGFSGDLASATSASLRQPSGLAIDLSGNLFLVDALNHRIRRIDAVTGRITTLAGNGIERYAGDSAAAVSASLDTPSAIALSPAGLPTIADTANQRIRQVDSASIIHTIAGLGASVSAHLLLSASKVVAYGTGAVAATLAASPATGLVTFFDISTGLAQTLSAIPLAGNIATLRTSTFAAGVHRLTATYPGDNAHPAAQSDSFTLTITPASLLATPDSVHLLYGQPMPLLTGTLTGLLVQDLPPLVLAPVSFTPGSPAPAPTPPAPVALTLVAAIPARPPPATYPIIASISGPAAQNYALTTAPAFISIAKAPTLVTLSPELNVHVASTTTGTPSGIVRLLDGLVPYASSTLSVTGDAVFSSAALSLGSHTLTAVYSGDTDFLAASSVPAFSGVGLQPTADFTLAATGQTTLTAASATAPTSFSFAVTPLNGTLSSPILLTASGLPTGFIASFNPAYLPPSDTPTAFILTILTPQSATIAPATLAPATPNPISPIAYTALLPLLLLLRKSRSRVRLCTAFLSTSLLVLTVGCGDRINHAGDTRTIARTYNITVIATATTASGATLQHTANVTLTLP